MNQFFLASFWLAMAGIVIWAGVSARPRARRRVMADVRAAWETIQ